MEAVKTCHTCGDETMELSHCTNCGCPMYTCSKEDCPGAELRSGVTDHQCVCHAESYQAAVDQGLI